MFSKKDGIITEIDSEALNTLRNHKVSVSLDYPVGAVVSAVQNGTSRIGQVVVRTNDPMEMEEIMSAVRHTIKIDGVDLEKLWNE